MPRTAKQTHPASALPKLRPSHPGEVLREDVLPTFGVGVTEAAQELGISRQMLHAILAERAPVTAPMAVRLGKWCGNGAQLWLAMQRQRDLWDAAGELAAEVSKIRTRRPRELSAGAARIRTRRRGGVER